MKTIIRISLVMAILTLASVFAGCGNDAAVTTDDVTAEVPVTSDIAIDAADGTEHIGEGQYTFDFTAVFADGTKETHSIATDCETVGEALLAEGLIGGEDSQYGLMVDTVCGVVADYEIDKTYWALYVGGEYSMTGVDSLKCADVTEVEFRVEK